jgi:glucose-6-phosphate 1-dehydrogenase
LFNASADFKSLPNGFSNLAMAPQFFGVISDYLKSSGLTDTKGFKRLVIENFEPCLFLNSGQYDKFLLL